MNERNPFSATHAYPHYEEPTTYLRIGDQLRAWEYDGWKKESLSWKQSCYIHAGLAGPQLLVDGPDADAFMSYLCTNSLATFPDGVMRHAVMCNEEGLIAAHGILQRNSEGVYRFFAAVPWPMVMASRLDFNVNISVEEGFITQVAGPRSREALQKACGEDLEDIGFLRYRSARIAGKTVEVGRIGMSGNLAYEVRGPIADAAAVYDAIYQVNRDIGIQRLGWRTYLVNHVEGGFPQMSWTFGSPLAFDERYIDLVGADHWSVNWHASGSYDPAAHRPRLRTPFEVNWDRAVRFDHEFLGRAALEREASNPPRRTVTLRWNSEDIIDIYSSLFRPGEEFKTLDLPTSPTWLEGLLAHADRVLLDGSEVGVSSGNIYSYHFRESLSLGCVDSALAKPGQELVVEWGDHGQRIKCCRVEVARFPYLEDVRNSEVEATRPQSAVRQ